MQFIAKAGIIKASSNEIIAALYKMPLFSKFSFKNTQKLQSC
jgi:hypothetical protein